MAKTLQFRRGSAAVAAAFTGANGEIFVNVEDKTVALHDGVNAGGTTLGSNASQISTGTLNTARLPATANIATQINVGANVNLSTSNINVGNSSVNSSLSATTLAIGNSSVNATITSSTIDIDGTITSGNVTVTGFTNVTREANTTGGGATVTVSAVSNIASNFGSSDSESPGSAQAVRGRLTGSNLTGTYNYTAGVVGQYLITGTNASNFPKVGILGVVGDQTTSADAAVMAYLDGDGGLTTANAAFGVSMKNSTSGSGFKYGLDLKYLDIGLSGLVDTEYQTADIRLQNGVLIRSETTAITHDDATSLPAGTIVCTNNATGSGKLFISDGSNLKQLAFVS